MISKFLTELRENKDRFIQNWVEEYKRDEEQMQAELFTLIVNVGGWKGEISKEMVQEQEEQFIVRHVIDAALQDSTPPKNLLEKPDRKLKHLKENYIAFLLVLGNAFAHDREFEQQLFPHLCTFLSLLSQATVLPLRHSATLTACKLVNGLSEAIESVDANISELKRKQRNESLQNRENVARNLDVLRREEEETRQAIERTIQLIYESVLRKRMRDVKDTISAMCLEEIANAIRLGARCLRSVEVLRNLGYVRFCPDVNVRLSAIKATEILLPCEFDDPVFTSFQITAKENILALRNDVEATVVCAAVNCLCIMIRKGSLTEEEEHKVFWLMCGTDNKAALAAGKCFVESVKREASEEWRSRGLKKLCGYIIHTKSLEYVGYFVDALFERMLTDWECLAEQLVDVQLTQEEKVVLSNVLRTCVQKAATGKCYNRKNTNPWLPRTTLDIVQTNDTEDEEQRLQRKSELSRYFIGVLSDLIEANYEDKKILANIIHLGAHFDMNMYFSLRKEQKLDDLLDFFWSEINETDDDEIVSAVANVLQKMGKDEAMTSSYSKTKVAVIIESLQTPFFDLVDSLLASKTENENFSDDELKQLQASIMKIGILAQYLVIPDAILEILSKIILEKEVWEDLGAQTLVAVIQGLKGGVCTKIVGLKNVSETESIPTKVEEVVEMQTRLMQGLRMMIQESLLTKQVTMILCDCIILFSSAIGSRRDLQPLIYAIDNEMKRLLERTLTRLLSVRPDADYEKRRNVMLLKRFIQTVSFGDLPYIDAAFTLQFISIEEFRPVLTEFIGLLKEKNKADLCPMFIYALIEGFNSAKENNRVGPEALTEMKVTAKHLTQNIPATPEYRKIITELHKIGITYAVTGYEAKSQVLPENIQFLEVLKEFVGKTMKMDRPYLIKYFDKRFKVGKPVNRWEGWGPLINYRDALVGKKSKDRDPA